MDNMLGKKIMISGMAIEIISDNDEKWKCRNITTKETLFIKKTVITNAIKLGKAEVIPEPNEK